MQYKHVWKLFEIGCYIVIALNHLDRNGKLLEILGYPSNNRVLRTGTESHCAKSVQIRSNFWHVFSCIRTEYGDSLCKSLYSVRIQENTDQK